ncbi:amidase domain-containing protein [Clostridium sp. YB-6]|uniref:Amidase domain-containing protein n=1 Tax=Clostridium weizhouense TaxID=2859781 RepID=A0ABS7AM32_9CLOT|nr:amidase domain-containing protein [Clostridium weizhouense]
MLFVTLHKFYHILSTPYDKFNLLSKKNFNITDSIFDDLYLKKFFNHLWISKLNSNISKIKSKYNYKILEKNFDLIKIKFNYTYSFSFDNFPKGIKSFSIDEYLIILKKVNKNYNIIFIVNKEDEPHLYENVFKQNLIQIDSLIKSDRTNIWNSKIKVLDRLYKKFLKTITFYRTPYYENKKFNYNPLMTCEYAEKFALVPNDKYKLFEDSGGDCTNFVSQAINFGGIETTKIWKPYTNSWVRVEELYSYLIYNKIGFEITEKSPMTKGSIIQFYNPKIGRFSHSGIITHTLSTGDYLYCCHSYNKLNYPLSLSYPVIYPKIRNIDIF